MKERVESHIDVVTGTPLAGLDPLLTTQEVLRLVKLSRTGWHYLQKRGRAPMPVRPTGSRAARYRVSDIRAFLDNLQSDPPGHRPSSEHHR